MSDLQPCQHATYVHFLIGGPCDGGRYPAGRCYETFESRGHKYEREGEAERVDRAPGMHVLNCTEDYMEPAFFRVNMKYVGGAKP